MSNLYLRMIDGSIQIEHSKGNGAAEIELIWGRPLWSDAIRHRRKVHAHQLIPAVPLVVNLQVLRQLYGVHCTMLRIQR